MQVHTREAVVILMEEAAVALAALAEVVVAAFPVAGHREVGDRAMLCSAATKSTLTSLQLVWCALTQELLRNIDQASGFLRNVQE
jgi:hypothetical protein